MSIAHILYIPGILMVGVVLGYVLGARAIREEVARARKRSRQ